MFEYLYMVIALIGTTIFFCKKTGKDLINKAYIFIIKIVITLSIILWIISGIFAGFYFLKLGIDNHELGFSFSGIMLLPTLSIIALIYFIINGSRMPNRKFSIIPDDSLPITDSTIKEIEFLRNLLLIKQNIIVKYSSQINCPRVFGTWKQTVLLLPVDFEKRLEKAEASFSNQGSIVPSVSDIRRFVLLHELAHVSNKDLFFLRISELILKFSMVHIPTILICSIRVVLTELTFFDVIALFLIIVKFSIIPYLIIISLYLMLTRYSEFLADTLAFQYLMTTPLFIQVAPGKGYSIFEFMLIYLNYNMRNEERKNSIVRNICYRLRKIKRFYPNLHPAEKHRRGAIEDNVYLFEFPKQWFFVGICFGLLSLMGFSLGIFFGSIGLNKYIMLVLVRYIDYLLMFLFAAIFSLKIVYALDDPRYKNKFDWLKGFLYEYFLSFIIFSMIMMLFFMPNSLFNGDINEIINSTRNWVNFVSIYYVHMFLFIILITSFRFIWRRVEEYKLEQSDKLVL